MMTDNPGYKNDVISDYPQLFTGLGEMHGTPHHIHLADNATPYSLSMPRRVPVPLIAKVDPTLGKMESQGVIRRIDEPTEWCAGMVRAPHHVHYTVRSILLSPPSIWHLVGSEFFQKGMSTILDGLPGVICLVDGILVFGACQEEHDQRLQAVLQRLASAGLTLNGEKCLFSVSQLYFCGYLMGKDSYKDSYVSAAI